MADDEEYYTDADQNEAVAALKPFCLHASVDLVESVAFAIKRERTRVEARQNQELAELRERYPDALFKAEDLLRQVQLLEAQVKVDTQILEERDDNIHEMHNIIERLEAQLKARHDELGLDAACVESAELERDRAKAEAQQAQQELKILKDAVQLTGEEQDMLLDGDVEEFLEPYFDRIKTVLKEIA